MGMVRESEELQREICEMLINVEGLAVNFWETLAWLRRGGIAIRRSWWSENGGKKQRIQMKNKTHLELKVSGETPIPWVITPEDLLANDWILLGYPKE